MLSHRGPDDEGFVDSNIGLASRRFLCLLVLTNGFDLTV